MSERYSRSDRVSEAIRRELAQLIATELKDPRVGMVSLTAVELTPDYAHAKIYYSTLAEGDAQKLIHEGLVRASGFLRREIGRRVRIHTTPQLHFIYDDSIERGVYMSRLIDEGKLGKIFHYRAKFLQDWTISKDLPQGGQGLWRLDAGVAGSGVTGDLLAHCIDTAMWLNGGITDVSAMTETFIKERIHRGTGLVQKVGIDDACIFHCHFDNGSLGLFESTRYARGHKALYTFEINGENKSLAWDLHDLNRLQFFDHSTTGQLRGWTNILVTDGDHPYLGKWWVPGLIIGYEHSFTHQVADFLTGLTSGTPAAPTFREALPANQVCDAIIASGQSGQWITL